MNRGERYGPWLSATAVAVLLVSSAQSARSQVGDLTDTVRVRVVEVDVQVTDKRGRPLTGLTADDFVLFEDGQPVSIEYFSTVEELSSRALAEIDAGKTSPADHRAPEGLGRLPFLAIYLDQLSLVPGHLERIVDDVAGLARSWEGRAVMALMVFDGSLDVEVPPTRDEERIVAGLQAVSERMSKGFIAFSDMGVAFDQINNYYGLGRQESNSSCGGRAGGAIWSQLVEFWRPYADREASLSRRLGGGLQEAIKTIGAIEGRKNLLYVSSGIVRKPGIALNEYIARLCPFEQDLIRREMVSYDLTQMLHEVAALANGARVTLHTLDAGGMRPLGATTVAGESSIARLDAHTSHLQIANAQSGLFTLAHDTGGRAVLNANQPLEALAVVKAELTSGYSLAFTPQRPPDRRLHRLKVRLRKPRKGVELEYRRWFRDRDDDQALVEELLAALQFGWGRNSLGIEAGVDETVDLGDDVIQASISVRVPVGETLAGAEKMVGLDFRVLAVAMDSEGRRTIVRGRDIPVVAANDSGSFVIRIKLPPEQYEIAVALELAGEGRMSYTIVEADLDSGDGGDPTGSGADTSGALPRGTGR